MSSAPRSAAWAWSCHPIPGAESALAEFRDSGVAAVLNTGRDRKTTRRLLRALRWDGLGPAGVVTRDDVRAGRPAHAAGVGLSVGVLTGAHGRERLSACPHSVILESVADLPGWLRSLGALRP